MYAPDGKVLVREVIEDDGIESKPTDLRTGGWDHEAWYRYLQMSRGSTPLIRWSAFSDPKRLALQPSRRFDYTVDGEQTGVYRVMVCGTNDNYVTLTVDPDHAMAIAGHPSWLHGHGEQYRKSYVYVPRGTTGLHVGFAEYDRPRTRRLTIKAPDGELLYDAVDESGFAVQQIKFDDPARFADKLLTVEVSEGDGDFMLHLMLSRGRWPEYRVPIASHAVFAPNAGVATAVQGGAIYHDDQVFWHPFQVRLHDWLKAQPAEAFVIRDADGNAIEPVESKEVYGFGARAKLYKGLRENPGFLPINGSNEVPPVSDTLMHSWTAHRSREALMVSIRDVANALRVVSTGDMATTDAWLQNMAYMFSSYYFPYYRPAYRIIQESDAPEEVKDMLRDAFILCGDRLSFCRGVARSNGNAFSHIVSALRYCHEATADPVQKKRFETHFERFTTEGWGPGVGISKAGDCQEHFAHAHHYGTYIIKNWSAPAQDFDDDRFRKVVDRVRELYRYTWNPEVTASPWSARTHNPVFPDAIYPDADTSYWYGNPGEDFTVSVNDADEWFAARRKSYYALTFHGRLSPIWLTNGFRGRLGRLGLGGGTLCQVQVPGKGVVIASRLLAPYGIMLNNWPNHKIHGIVGTMHDGMPLVTADSIHDNAALEGNVVRSSGEVRNVPVRIERTYTFEDDAIVCEARMDASGFAPVFGLWIPQSQPPLMRVREAWEMIPYFEKPAPGSSLEKTKVTLWNDEGLIGPIGEEAVVAKSVLIDRGGFGVRIELDKPTAVHHGAGNTVLIQLIDKQTAADQIAVRYRVVPFVEDE